MSEWFVSNDDKINEKHKTCIFTFPYAGGGASSFKNWQNCFSELKVYATQYPGRENRILEKPISDFNEVLSNLYKYLLEIIDKDTNYYFFGHSLGTKFAYELALKIKNSGVHMPKGIIVSAGKAPCYKEDKPIHHFDDKSFIKEINRFSGTPTELIENFDIMKVFLPMLRSDFMLDETYVNPDIVKIDVPILGLMGTEDEELTINELLKWQEYTNKDFYFKYIEGGHMFVNTNTERVIDEIKNFIRITND